MKTRPSLLASLTIHCKGGRFATSHHPVKPTRKAPPTRMPWLDYVTARLIVNQRLREEIRASLELKNNPVLRPALLETIETISLLRGAVLASVGTILQDISADDCSSRHPTFALQRIAVWLLFVVGSDLNTPPKEVGRVLSQLQSIVQSTGLQAAARVAYAISRNIDGRQSSQP